MVDEFLHDGATPNIVHSRFSSDAWQELTASVPKEIELTIFVNEEELVTILCTPTRLIHLVIGFLYTEGIIADKNDIASMRVCEEDLLADIRLSKPGYKQPQRRTLASGCGGGISFASEGHRVNSNLVVSPGNILFLMKQLNRQADLYRACGGVHTAALADAENLMVITEDIGRHNTLDKIMGHCLMTGLSTKDKVLLTTGRISSEMLSKASRMETPVVISRSSPTDRAISLARELSITLVGYVRGDHLSVYSHQERVQGAPDRENLRKVNP
jgi:FdhD protein